VSRASDDQTEPTIAIDPTHPDHIFIASNTTDNGLFAAYSTNAGATWFWTDPADGTIADGRDGLPVACCDPSASAVCDPFGNIFLAYIRTVPPKAIIVLLSTNGGYSFTLLATLASNHNLDKPTLVTGCGVGSGLGTVWVTYKDFTLAGTPVVVVSAVVTNLGIVSAFSTGQSIPGTTKGNFGDIAVGPGGQVLLAYQDTTLDEGPSTIYVSLDPDGRGPAPFGTPVAVATVGVGSFDLIPATPDRGIYANPTFAWDNNPASPFFSRVYMSYTDEIPDESDDTDIFVRYSDNSGESWSEPIRVNDDATTRSQFFPRIAVDPTSGALAASWYDCRNDSGAGPDNRFPGPNNDVQFYGSVSFDGGVTWSTNFRISDGTSTEDPAQNGNDYGDYTALAFYNGNFYPVWADNSNSTGDNPDDDFNMDIYTARVQVGIIAETPTVISGTCAPSDGVLEPGETVTLNVPLRNALGPATTNLTATLLTSGGVILPSGPQEYGVLTAGGATVSRPFTFTVGGECGGVLSATLQLEDGGRSRGTVLLSFPLGAHTTNIQTFTASSAITIPDESAGSPYPETINVSGYSGVPGKVTVTLNGITHPYPDDLDILLVGPLGQKVMLMSDAGVDYALNDVTITLDDVAPPLPDFSPIRPGTYAPANFTGPSGDLFPAPAPAGPYVSTLSAFAGIDPNGTWSLYVRDDAVGDTGSIAGGWSLHLWSVESMCCEPSVSLSFLRLGNNLRLTWPAVPSGYRLEAKTELNSALAWGSVFDPVVSSNGVNSVMVPIGSENRFFRLSK
jgi:subtilisin-like proprotein convertase family protein